MSDRQVTVAWEDDFADAVGSAAQLTPQQRREAGAQEAVRRELEARISDEESGDESKRDAKLMSTARIVGTLAFWSPEERDELLDIAREAAQVAWTHKYQVQYLADAAVRWPEVLDESWIDEVSSHVDEIVARSASASGSELARFAHTLSFLCAWFKTENVICPDLDLEGLFQIHHGGVQCGAIDLFEYLPSAAQQRYASALAKVFFENLHCFPKAWFLLTVTLDVETAASVCTPDQAIRRACELLTAEDDPEIDGYYDRRHSRDEGVKSIFDAYSSLDPEIYGDLPKLVDAVLKWFKTRNPTNELSYSDRAFYNALAWAIGGSRDKDKAFKQPWTDFLVQQLGNENHQLAFVRYATEALASGCDLEGGEVNLTKVRAAALACSDPERARYFGRFLPQAFTKDSKAFSKMLAESSPLATRVCVLEALLTLPPADFLRLMPKNLAPFPAPWKALSQRAIARKMSDGAFEEISWKGVSFQLLLELTYDPAYYHGMTTADMLETVVKPVSLGYGSAADAPFVRRRCPVGGYGVNQTDFGMIRPLSSAYATEFVSHSWRYTFAMVMDMLQFGSNADLDAYYWFDLLVVDQHDAPSRPATWWDTTFRNAVGSFGHLSLAVDFWKMPTTLTRIWCIWEIYSSLDLAGEVELCFPWREEREGARAAVSDVSQVAALLDDIDVASADATYAADKTRILDAINASESASVDIVNQRIRAFFASCLLGYAAYYGPAEVVYEVLRYEPRLDMGQKLSLDGMTRPIQLPAQAALEWASPNLIDSLLDVDKVPQALREYFMGRALFAYFRAENEKERTRYRDIIELVAMTKEVSLSLDDFLSDKGYLNPTEEMLEPLRAIAAAVPVQDVAITKPTKSKMSLRLSRPAVGGVKAKNKVRPGRDSLRFGFGGRTRQLPREASPSRRWRQRQQKDNARKNTMDTKKALKLAAGAGLGVLAAKTLDEKLCISSDLAQIETLKKYALLEQLPEDATVADVWEATVAATPDKVAVIFAESGEKMSFREVDAMANRVAAALRAQGLGADDVVALFANNCIEYVYLFLGIAKAGMVAAVINSNNKAKPLLHSLEVASCSAIVYAAELEEQLEEIAEDLAQAAYFRIALSFDEPSRGTQARGIPVLESRRLEDVLPGPESDISSSPAFRAWRAHSSKLHPCSYIYTSGTTGLPKACVVTNYRLLLMFLRMKLYNVGPDDITYTCLPLYHSSGLGIGLGNAILQGSTIVLSRKFSASRFFKHCAEHNVTAVQYIGEVCRYLLHSPASPWDRKHKVRVAIGNGLRKEIWVAFQERFQIPEIGEFYGATEGNLSFTNHCRGVLDGNHRDVGIVARVGPLLKERKQFKIVRHDVATEQPVRDPTTGYCVECARGEPGELLGPIDPARKATMFMGYTGKEATDKKILKNVLKEGDCYFRTGDLIRHDLDGSVIFVDRVGDTFRYKGENVATGEVPGSLDGRACMAAVVLDPTKPNVDWAAFSDHVHHSLATYAVPHFVRILTRMDLTGTLKHRKVDLAKEGIDPTIISDSLWYLDTSTRSYKPLDAKSYADIVAGKARL
ncbi:Long-chain fatty acid transport protein 4 [Hondaea fermentalgiana]|uniref:Long-chain fatty acid transport protein 4 n=1 Tax=Hondaea fermentalgiana TaxID=2315210 RepID=A0A2R5GJS3_9STRA|nr:Long-chain fatty acid transport protein 4 [Hondaea fermentalgiana]|eukprot:GBG30875.1 Long-chain fatty acid transport protein 4 [Hondaea fermentalgiana]